jgi:hypothetical protein
MIKLNVITRCSRQDKFLKTLDSLNKQRYNNIKHYITYQNDEILNFLQNIEFKYETELVRVPNLKKIDNLSIMYELDDVRIDYLNPDWDYMNRKVILDNNHFFEEQKKSENRKKVEVLKYEKDGFWCTTFNSTTLRQSYHLPYNLFLKIAEQKVTDGWIFLLDDDDTLVDENSLLILSDEIKKHNEDTLHIFKMKRKPNTVPSNHYFKYMKTGHPILYGEIGSSCISYHSKYKDYTMWDEWANADYRTAKALEKIIPNKNFFDKVIVDAYIGNGGEDKI